MLYNRELFEEHGLSEPQTWDEFINILRPLPAPTWSRWR
jgi:ABC-type glycerol-3-phosphate transport system substrate-binding protein